MGRKETAQTPRLEQTAADQAYAGIIDLILHHELRPGERTSVNLLAARLSLGRTPVKEAITRLQTEGLLSVAGRSGTIVKLIGRDQAEQLFALRRVLENFAADGAVVNITPEQLKTLHKLLEEMEEHSSSRSDIIGSAARFVRANVAFHFLIVSAAGNPYLSRLYAQLQMHLQIVTYLVQRGYDPKAAERRQREHELIARALASRNAKALKTALRDHSETTEQVILASLDASARVRAGTRPGKTRARADVS
ncbi:MAG: GntR family transcriptional regulator [Hyphomonadaceae bacterium]|nr:GntR family transcriptional regulator [Hyphomonadaceae bacterium]